MPAKKRISESLYELSDSLQRAILHHVDPDTGELDEAFEAELDKLEGDFREKCVQTALYVKGLQTEAAAVNAMASAIADQAVKEKARSEVLLRQSERLLAYLDNYLRKQGLTEIKDPRARIHYRMNPETCEVITPSLVPEEFRLDPKPPEPSKTLLLAALKIRDAYELKDGDIVYAKRVRKPSTLKIS